MLRGLQRNEHLSNKGMALRLGVSPSTVSMVYRGCRNPGPKFLRGVLKAYPQLRDEVYSFLLLDANGRA